jgi:hypothetical protein
MARNDNWGHLPDYSHQNHTLKFTRRASGLDTYHAPQGRIPFGAWVGGVCFALGMVGVMWLGYFAGFSIESQLV